MALTNTDIYQTQVNQSQTNSTDNSVRNSYADNSVWQNLIDNRVDSSVRNTNTFTDNTSIDNSSKWSYSDSSSYNYQVDNSVKNTNTFTDNTNNSVNNTYTDNRSFVDNTNNSVDNSFTYTDNSQNDNSVTDNSDNSTKVYNFDNINGPVFFQSSVSGGIGNTSISGGVGNTHIDNSRNTYTDNSVTNIDNSVTTVTDNSVTETDNSTNVVSQGNAFVYSGGDQVIDNYKAGDKIKLASDYQGIGLEGDSFFVNSSSGSLEIKDSRDKFIEYTDEDDKTVAYTYVASGAGEIDGRGKSQAEIMIGGDNADNQITAGEGASSLWGGNGGNDVMIGGEGYTEFFYAIGSGNDVVQNSSSSDVVNLLGVSLEQITNVDVNISEVSLNFVDGGSLKIEGNTGIGYKLGDTVYTVNQSTQEWSTKEQPLKEIKIQVIDIGSRDFRRMFNLCSFFSIKEV